MTIEFKKAEAPIESVIITLDKTSAKVLGRLLMSCLFPNTYELNEVERKLRDTFGLTYGLKPEVGRFFSEVKAEGLIVRFREPKND